MHYPQNLLGYSHHRKSPILAITLMTLFAGSHIGYWGAVVVISDASKAATTTGSNAARNIHYFSASSKDTRASGKERFLETTGSDTGNCTDSARPCRTFNYVDRHSSPGDMVHVAPGTYTLTPSTCIVTNTSGVTWQSDVHGAATIDGGGNCQYIWHNSGNSGNIRVLGFQFTGVQVNSSLDSVGVLLEGCNGGFEVAYNTFHDLGTSNSKNNFGSALTVSPYGCGTGDYTGRTCTVHDNVFYNIAPGGNFSLNGYSIYAACGNHGGADPDPSIYNNLIYNEGSIGIHMWHAADHIHVYNNTIDNAYIGILVGTGDQGAVRNAFFDVSNNIVSNGRKVGIEAEDSANYPISPKCIFQNNLLYNNATDWHYNHAGKDLTLLTSFRAANNTTGNPLYVDPGAGKYVLRGSSPAAGKALRNSYASALDLAGIKRPNPPSIGAYEPR